MIQQPMGPINYDTLSLLVTGIFILGMIIGILLYRIWTLR
jgi:hypothetical protein